MIVLNLRCDRSHRFEGWFPCNEKFEGQCRQGLVTCPTCGSARVERLPSAPAIASPKLRDGVARHQAAQMLRKLAREALDVGVRFPEEARRMHYGETEPRAIRGVASAQAVVELLDEGVSLIPLPSAATDEEH